MYSICLSDNAVEELQYTGVLEERANARNDTIWFISEDEDLTKKVMEYFEYLSGNNFVISNLLK